MKKLISTIMLVFMGITIFVTCINTDDDFNPISGDEKTSAICAVFNSLPDTNTSLTQIIKAANDSITVTINDTLYFAGFITNTKSISKLTSYWVYGDGNIDSGFGLIPHTFDNTGRFVANFIIFDDLGNSDTANVLIIITNKNPIVESFFDDTIIDLSDSILLAPMITDDGKIKQTIWYLHIPAQKNGSGDTAIDTIISGDLELLYNYFSPKLIIDTISYKLKFIAIDDDANKVTDSATISIVLHCPKALAGNDTTITPNDTVILNGSNSSSKYGICSYQWDVASFSDTTSDAISSHIFPDTGTFIITLLVNDSMGNIGTKDTMIVTVIDSKPLLTIDIDTVVIESGAMASFSITATDEYGKIIALGIDKDGNGTIDTMLAISDSVLWENIYTVSGFNRIIISAEDDDGNHVIDTVGAWVNSAPDSIKLITPANNLIGQSLNPVFTWNGLDHDFYDSILTYTLILSHTGNNNDTLINSLANITEHTLATSLIAGETVNWFVIATDSFGLVTISDTFSFTTSPTGAVDGDIDGQIYRERFEGITGNTGISITAYGSGVEKGATTSDDTGFYCIENLTGLITLVYKDYGFLPESTDVSIINGVTTHIATNSLLDTLAPVISITALQTVKQNENVTISWSATDTFYTVDSIFLDIGYGYQKIDCNDTTLSYSTSGDHAVKLKAFDLNGNVSEDSVVIHVNYPPTTLTLISPINHADVAINTSPLFKWSCEDRDNKNNLRYTLYIGTIKTLGISDIEATALSDTSYVLSSSGSIWGTYYWKIIAVDGYDTLESVVDSFRIGEYVLGRIEGYALLQGMTNNTGIKLTAKSQIDTISYDLFVDNNGYFFANILPRTYTLSAIDTLHDIFTSDATTSVVFANDTAYSDTLLLLDTVPPQITCTYPFEGVILAPLPRSIDVTGTFSDIGSQVRPDLVIINLNGKIISNATISSSAWSFNISPIADGNYTVIIIAKDNSGNIDTLTRIFSINSKIITASQTINHDTLYASVTMSDVRPNIHAYYWDMDGNGTWDDSSVTTATSAKYNVALDDYTFSGTEHFFVKALDDSGSFVVDTVSFTVGSDTPIANAGNDTIISMGDSITLRGTYTQTYGHIVKWEWKINNYPWAISSGPDTTVTPQDRYQSNYSCILRITDDNGLTDTDTMNVTVGKDWVIVGGGAISEKGSNSYSIDIDYYGSPHIAYTDTVGTNKGYVYVKKFNGTAWESVGGVASTATAKLVDLELGFTYEYGGAINRQYFLSYVERYVPSMLRIKRYNGSSWINEVDTITVRGSSCYDLACSPTSTRPSIAYRNKDNSWTGIVKYKNLSNSWDTRGSDLASSWYDNISLSPGGTVAFYEHLGTYRLSIYLSGTWNNHVISGFSPNYGNILNLGQYGNTNIYLSYQDKLQSNKISVKNYNGTSWSYLGTASFSKGRVYGHKMVQDNYPSYSSHVYIAYFDFVNGTGSLVVKHFNGTDWITVGTEGFATETLVASPQIAVDKGKIYVAYKDYSNGGKVTVITLK